ncbi:MAG: hypothetical protein WCH01_02315 [Methylococcaceae bacterium]
MTTIRKIFEENYSEWLHTSTTLLKQHALEPPDDFLRHKSEVFGIDIKAKVENVLPIMVCQNLGILFNKHLPLIVAYKGDLIPGPPPDPRSRFKYLGFDEYSYPVSINSIDNFKQLLGVPNTILEKKESSLNVKARFPVSMNDLPTEKNFKIQNLDQRKRLAMQHMLTNVRFGYIDDEFRKSRTYEVVDHWIKTEPKIPVFLGNDLLVCNNQCIEFHDYGAIYFNNVIVYGNGRIRLRGASLHAYHIKHVD